MARDIDTGKTPAPIAEPPAGEGKPHQFGLTAAMALIPRAVQAGVQGFWVYWASAPMPPYRETTLGG